VEAIVRILVIGATGTIGRAVAEALHTRHEVVPVAHRSGALTVDLASPDSIRALFGAVGQVDAVVSCAGRGAFKPLGQLSDADFALSLSNKLMGQVNLVRLGAASVNEDGCFTLTSGILSRYPSAGGAALSMVNGALEAFARAAALEMPRRIRVNVISPPWVSETLAALGRDASGGLPAAVVARSYLRSVEGSMNGETIDARTGA
jgi:NAD(P)-dependent dehydrogenase (short-subunit alcohol dehydrogenase family)